MNILARKNQRSLVRRAFRVFCLVTVITLPWTPQLARADDFGCKVLLCLADPRGPETEQQCVPPIEQMKAGLAHGDPFPTCDMGSQGQGTYATQVYTPWNPCTAPLTSAPTGVYIAVQSTVTSGNPNGFSNAQLSDGQMAFACVGNLKAQTSMRLADDGDFRDGTNVAVNVYDQVLWETPQSPRAIDVYISGKFWQRYHW